MLPDTPAPDEAAPDFAPYWEGVRRGELLVRRCGNGHRTWPPRPNCPVCLIPAQGWIRVSGAGEVYSWTVVHRSQLAGFDALTPYAVVVVALADCPPVRMLGRYLGEERTLRIGAPVVAVFEKVAGGLVLPLWRPDHDAGDHAALTTER